MSGRRRPPHLRLVGTDIENRQVKPPPAYPLLDSLKVAVAPLEDAARCMADDAVRVVVDAAADFGFPANDTDTLREEVRQTVIRFALGWIAQRLAEYREGDGQDDDVPGV